MTTAGSDESTADNLELVRAESAEIELIEHALDCLLRAIRDHEQQRPRRKPIFRLLTVDEITRQSPIQSLLTDPVGAALRRGIKQLGVRLHELGGVGLMQSVCERVAAKDPRWRGNRISIIDHRWSGIGSDAGGWWWA